MGGRTRMDDWGVCAAHGKLVKFTPPGVIDTSERRCAWQLRRAAECEIESCRIRPGRNRDQLPPSDRFIVREKSGIATT